MKSVEFLIALLVVITLYSILFQFFNTASISAEEKVKKAGEELEIAEVSSLISAICYFGYPFDYTGPLPRVNELNTDCRAFYNPVTMRYEFESCRRYR